MKIRFLIKIFLVCICLFIYFLDLKLTFFFSFFFLSLELLYLGGNLLTEIPSEVGCLSKLNTLALCDNKIHTLPRSLIHLGKLRSLSLHNNQLSTLPQEIVSLDLVELSLRNNPLVVRFVKDLVCDPPSLLELAGRTIKVEKLKYGHEDIPENLQSYLESAKRCVNPKCKGKSFLIFKQMFSLGDA